MAKIIKTKIGLRKAFDKCSEEVRAYFEHLPRLVEEFPLDVCLSYMFARMELAQNMALYCGVVKVHRVHISLARNAVNGSHMTREGFRDQYRTVFDTDPPAAAQEDLRIAEKVRDSVMHGKPTSDGKLRNAIAEVLWYAEEINKQLTGKAGFKPFCSSLQGFSGSAKKLDKSTSRWILKGMGFEIR